MPNGTGLETGDGSIVVPRQPTCERTNPAPSDLRDHAGIAVHRRAYAGGPGLRRRDSRPASSSATTPCVGYQQPSDSDGFGIVVEGTNMTVRNNTVTDNDVGIQIQQGHTPYIANDAGDGHQANLADSYLRARQLADRQRHDRVQQRDRKHDGHSQRRTSPRRAPIQTCNWWNQISGPTAAANPGGSGQTKTGNGAFAPWLIYGTDADVGTEGLPASRARSP